MRLTVQYRWINNERSVMEPNNLRKKAVALVLVILAAVMVVSVPAASRGNDKKAVPITKSLPLLIDLGATQCIPCKMMAPILEEVKKEYAGSLHVEFIDVWKNPDAGQKYRIRAIPTQIFYDASGRELYRHMGFMSKQDILGAWKELGIELKQGR
jgi:thioredoxin 1